MPSQPPHRRSAAAEPTRLQLTAPLPTAQSSITSPVTVWTPVLLTLVVEALPHLDSTQASAPPSRVLILWLEWATSNSPPAAPSTMACRHPTNSKFTAPSAG